MKKIISQINFGYERIEAIIISLMALNKNFILIGKHGSGKTKLAKYLSKGFDEKSFVFYDATKDDLISIAGIPDPNAMKEGKMKFIPHERTIFDKTTILVDEISRASRENQNMWLEILEEKTCFGIPLNYKSLIATANPESYAATNKIDDALMSRFCAVINVREFAKIGADSAREIMKMNMSEPDVKEEEIRAIFDSVRVQHEELRKSNDVEERVLNYTSNFVSLLFDYINKKKLDVYISPRTFGKHFIDVLYATAAYYYSLGVKDPLVAGAVDAYTFTFLERYLGTDAALTPAVFHSLHRDLKFHLKVGKTLFDTNRQKLIMAFEKQKSKGVEEVVKFFRKNKEEIIKELSAAELNQVLYFILEASSNTPSNKLEIGMLIGFYSKENEVSKKIDSNILNNLNGSLKVSLNKIIKNIFPMLKDLEERCLKGNSTQKKIRGNILSFKRILKKDRFHDDWDQDLLRIKSTFLKEFGSEQVIHSESEGLDILSDLFSRVNLQKTEMDRSA